MSTYHVPGTSPILEMHLLIAAGLFIVRDELQSQQVGFLCAPAHLTDGAGCHLLPSSCAPVSESEECHALLAF